MRHDEQLANYIDIGFSPCWDLIPSVRKFVSSFYDRFVSKDASFRIALTTHELLENAVKYSRDPDARVYVGVSNDGHGHVMVRVESRSAEANIAELREVFARMHAMPDAQAFYQERMRSAVTRNHGSGLGLARIWAEADFALELTIENELVIITARSQMTPATAGATA
jgi:hypothetical protein